MRHLYQVTYQYEGILCNRRRFFTSHDRGAKENCRAYPQFVQGDTLAAGPAENTYVVVLKRVLIHYLKDLNAFFQEAYRLLRNKIVP